ncbi:MAG: hypothetical protein J5524_08985 [Bacteroidaceae bacterium]|nr:hypothetical protein [Bacteroidaceae bacterium]MBO4841216.1 hypothetical protein [Bacteroidaceae bacterium]
MELNRYVALLITLLVDVILLGFGSFLIASANTGGTFVYFIECSIIFAVHRALYRFLTGKKTKETEDGEEVNTSPDLYSIFCEAWLYHDTKRLARFVADSVLCKNEKGEETVPKKQFLLWVSSFYKRYAVFGKDVLVTAEILIDRDGRIIYTVVDEINEYEITLNIDNKLIVGLCIKPSCLSFSKEHDKTLVEGINAAKLIMDKYAKEHLDVNLFQWILDKPIQKGYVGIKIPHLLFFYNGIKYGIFVEVYADDHDAPVCMWNKLDYDAFVQQSKEDDFEVCFLQIDKATMKPCHSQGVLQDATGHFIELNPQKS